jgi:hypothetical protein
VGAVVAAKLARPLVQHEGDVAAGTVEGVTARPTGKERRPAAAIEQHDRLPPTLAELAQRLARALVERSAAPVPGPHVEYLDRWQRLALDPLGELQALELEPALGPRRRAAADEDRASVRCSPTGHLAGVIARVALLLVRGVVLLIDHDEAEICDRRKGG